MHFNGVQLYCTTHASYLLLSESSYGEELGAEFPTAEQDRVVQPRNCAKVRKWRVNSLRNDLMADDNICRYLRSHNCQDIVSFFFRTDFY
jgi:hypothetical protein